MWWWWLPSVIVAILLYLVYTYHRTYQRPLVRAIDRAVDSLRRDDGGSGGDGDEVDRGSAIMRERAKLLREGLAASIDSLPPVRFQSALGRGGDTRNGGDDDDDADDEDEIARMMQRECLSTGVFLSPTDDYIDCRTYCHVSDGVQYRYFERADRLLNTGRIARRGSYCLPTAAAICNDNTSLVVYTRDGWKCMPQTRAFAGVGGNRIVACDGRLLDRATGILWREFINPTLKFTDIDERLPSTAAAADDDDSYSAVVVVETGDIAAGTASDEAITTTTVTTAAEADDSFRFVCPPGSKDAAGNDRLVSPYDRLQLLDNYCASLIPYAERLIRPRFDLDDDDGSGRICDCGRDNFYDEELRKCVPFDSPAFDERSLETTIVVRPCVEMWSRPSTLAGINIATGDRPIPCGIEADSDAPIGSMPAVMRERALIFDRAVPSPAAMLSSKHRR